MVKSKVFSTGIILLLAITISHAANVEGFWEVNKTGELVEIRTTDYGLMAKFVQSSSWDHYDRVKKGVYEDRKGNRYYVKNSSRISWESRNGRQVINLEKSQRRAERRGRSDDYAYNEGYRNRNRNDSRRNGHTCTSACGSSCSVGVRNFDDGLSGTWVSRWRNLVAHVEYDGYSVRMKTSKSRKWTTYRKTNAKRPTFEDRWGNRLRFKKNGKLEWRRADGRRDIDFRRDNF